MREDGNSIVVWDDKTPLPAHFAGRAILWCDVAGRRTGESILRQVELNSASLRMRYLSFVHELGEARINGVPVTDRLEVGYGASLWQMSLLAEKSYSKSPRISDCLRLLALEDLLGTCGPGKLILYSNDKCLAEALAATCGNIGRDFKWHRLAVGERKTGLRMFLAGLPHALQSVVWLVRHALQNARYLLGRSADWPSGRPGVLICTYSAYMDARLAGEGRFRSAYWTDLPAMIMAGGFPVVWLHKIVPSETTPDAAAAMRLLERFNADPRENGFHVALQSFLSLPILARVLMQWSRGMVANWRLRGIRRHFRPAGSSADLWPLLRDDWLRSVIGVTAITNLIESNCFRAALKRLPPQCLGLYPREGQAWEGMLVGAWRERQRAKLIGVLHSTARYWDLRHFADPRDLAGGSRFPLPDLVAVNGPVAYQAYLDAGFSAERLVAVEALRYLALAGFREKLTSTRVAGPVRVLVLGSIDKLVTRAALSLLADAMPMLKSEVVVSFKAHPFAPIDAAEFPGLRLELVAAPLATLASTVDVAFASNVTTAVLDMYELGIPVVIHAAVDGLNMNPLRGLPGALFVDDAESLAAAIGTLTAPRAARPAGGYFFLDSGLPRWREVLSQCGGGTAMES